MHNFTKNIPLERFHNSRVYVQLQKVENVIVGICVIDDIESQLSVREDDHKGLWLIDFNEIVNLRFAPSRLVRDCYWDNKGDMIHVPEKGEWHTYGYKIL